MNNTSLLVLQGVEQGTRFELADKPVAIGRGVQNEIRLLDTEVSRVHATIQRIKDTYVLTDRNSSNGTQVNGMSIRTRELVDGDQIQVGRTLLLYIDAEKKSNISSAAERIHLLQHHDPADRSNIIERVDQHQMPLGTMRTTSAADGREDSIEGTSTPFAVLYRIAEEVVRPSLSLEQSLQRILDLTIRAISADRGCILLADPQTGEIRPQVVSSRAPNLESGRMPVSRTIVDYVLKNRHGVRTADAQHDSRFAPGGSIFQSGIREAMCVPMQGRHELMGVIYVDITSPSAPPGFDTQNSGFREEQLRMLVAIGRQAALAVENSRYQSAVVKAERLAAMGQTIATLSHHIKNILQGIRGGSYLIDMGLNDHNEDMVRKGWHVVEKNQTKIYDLVMDMLTFSKERKPMLAPASLNETVSDVIELMQARAVECGVDLRYRPDPNLGASTFDAEAIHRAVLNIITNAIDAVDGCDRAIVIVDTGIETSSDMIWVTVADNGPGIPEDQLARIFNVFESSKGARGTGLGLGVSQKIIREHGGDITVESQLGQGSRFKLAWPRVDLPHVSPSTVPGNTLIS